MQRPVILAAALLALPLNAAWSDTSVIGQTYPITEPDAQKEIQAKVKATAWDPSRFGTPETWSGNKSLPLAESIERRRRFTTPFFELPFDIPNALPGHEGEILYPAGYVFNPLEYISVPGRLIIVREAELDWGLAVRKPGDMVILAGGDVIDAVKRHETPIYVLEPQVKARIALTHAPAIVWQEGVQFRIEEIPAAQIADVQERQRATADLFAAAAKALLDETPSGRASSGRETSQGEGS